MSSLAVISTLMFLSTMPVVRADIHCDISISGTNICSWLNDFNRGVAIAAVGGIATLVVFLAFTIYAALSRPRVSVPPMSYAPSNQPQVSADPAQPYAFSVPGGGWQSSRGGMPDKEWVAVDLSRDPYYER